MTLTDRLLRPALEAALAEARAGLSNEPSIPAPPRLRRLLGFTKPTGPALQTVRRVVDEDTEFRTRVRDATSADAVGEAGWLWLDRPSGWKSRFARLLEAAEVDEADMAADRGLAQVQRALERTEAALERVTARAETTEAALAGTNAELARERGARRAADDRAATAESALVAASDERAEALRAWKDTERALAAAQAELHALRAGGVEPPTADVEPGASAGADAAEGTAAPGDRLDRVVLGEALARVADAVAAVGAALEETRSLIDPTVAADRSEAAAVAAAPTPRRVGRRGSPRRRREPSPLPPGRFDDDPAVLDHLARLPGAMLLLDGYNVTKTAWPEAPPAEQRERLLALLDSLNARTGAEAVAVFDGSDVDVATPTPTRRAAGAVRVRFSPSDVEADDVVLDLAAQVPPTRPVIVVSSDNRVRDGARAIGVNVIGAAQFLASPSLGRSQSA